MMLNNSKGFKNLTFGILAQVITIAAGIIIPRLVLVNLGSEANGLLSSVSSILVYMTLLEAGVGTATVQALYHPCSENDHNSINRIMSATNYFYKRTGYVYFAIVLLLSVVYTFFVKTEVPRIDVFLVVFLAGLSGVVGYFFQGKLKLLLIAEGRNYVITNISTVTSIVVSLLKAMILISGGNVVALQLLYFGVNLVQMIVIVLYIRHNYQWLDMQVEPDFQAIGQRKAVLVHQITELIFNNTDVIVLTAFTSLKTVSVYSMYAMIFGMVKSVAVTFSDSFTYAVGQAYGDKKRFERIFNAYEVFNMAFTFAFFCIAAILMLPFLRIYTDGVKDINYIDSYVLWLFVIFYLMQNGRKSSMTVINVAQHFEKTKWRAVLEASINLSTSIVLTYKLGIYGVLLGTITALLYRTNDAIIYAAKLMERSSWITYRRWFTNIVVFIVSICVTSKITIRLDDYFSMVIYGLALCVTIIPLFIGVNSIMNPSVAKDIISVIKDKFGKQNES